MKRVRWSLGQNQHRQVAMDEPHEPINLHGKRPRDRLPFLRHRTQR